MKKIFLSRPNTYDPVYNSTVKALTNFLEKRGLTPVTIGSTVFPNEMPILTIKQEMKNCSGIIILGLPQLLIENCIQKKNTNGEKKILDKEYPSVWNQIEGAMAYMFDLPIMIIAQKGINDGLFENGTLPVFKNEYNLRSSHWIERQNFYEPFNEWFDRL